MLAIAARLFNFRHWDSSWRVTPQLLEQGGVTVACSVLYRPFSEMDLDEPYGAPPESAYFAKLLELIDAVEAEVDRSGGIIVRNAADLERDGLRYVHCVEGGFHLGATADEVQANVKALADRGVLYITLAHLFWRGIAANTPALPFLPDAVYNALFPQKPGLALSDLGEALVRAMYEHRVLVDISHMRDDAIDETFALIEALDRETGRDPREYPVIVSHAGYRFGRQKYNLTDGQIARIAARGGVIGLIFAQHQITDGLQRTRHQDAAGVARRAGAPHRRDRPRARRDRLGPRRLHQADARRDRERARPGAVRGRAAGALSRDQADAMLSENALRVIRTRFASAAP